MDDAATPDQRVLLDASVRFIDQQCPLETVRAGTYREVEYRKQAAELGWFSLLVPEEAGGGSLSGNGLVDAALVAFERGRRLQPGAFVGTNVVALALAHAKVAPSAVLPALISGAESAAWVVGAAAGNDVPGHGLRVVDGRLSGSVTFVPDAATAAWLLVSTDDGPQFLVPADRAGVTVVGLESLDITRRFAEVRLDDVAVTDADRVQPDVLVDGQVAVAAVLTAAESVGAMDHDLGLAVQYAKDRIAFGRPIGSFQAVKHLLADTSLDLEMAKAITLAAARTLGSGDMHGPQAVSMAKAFVGDVGITLAQSCFQVFGGIGYTWEHDQHLYLRRLTTDAALYGSPAWHRERLIQMGVPA
jgi:alkylation response protein AidB-like acyl-CoA dehydrogenase